MQMVEFVKDIMLTKSSCRYGEYGFSFLLLHKTGPQSFTVCSVPQQLKNETQWWMDSDACVKQFNPLSSILLGKIYS